MKIFITVFATFMATMAPAFGQASEDDRRANTPIEPFRIVENIYYVGPAEVTAFLIATPKGHILIDGGYPETVSQIRANVAKLGFKLEDIKIMLNTQAHFDHAGAMAEIKRITGARVYASSADKVLLENGGKGDFAFGDTLPYEPVSVDRIIRNGDKVSLGGVSLRAVLTPGHTKGCTSWTYEFKDGGRKSSAIFVGSTTSPGYSFYNNAKYPGIIADYEFTFKKLSSLRPNYFFASHGSFFDLLGKAERLKTNSTTNPFFDPSGYQEFVAATEKAFREKLANEKRVTK